MNVTPVPSTCRSPLSNVMPSHCCGTVTAALCSLKDGRHVQIPLFAGRACLTLVGMLDTCEEDETFEIHAHNDAQAWPCQGLSVEQILVCKSRIVTVQQHLDAPLSRTCS